jgi:hypothetical protein
MIKRIKVNQDEAKSLSLELEAEVLKLKTLLSKLETNIGLLQTSGSWNGANAYDVIQSLIGHLDHDYTLLSKLEKCSDNLKSIVE